MKKLSPGRLSHKVGVVTVYESDIADFIDILREKPQTVVSLEHEAAEFDDINDLRSHRGEFLRTLKISAKVDSREIKDWGTLSIDFMDDSVWLFGDSNFELQFRKIQDLLMARRRWMGKVPDPFWHALSGGLWVASSILIAVTPSLLGLPRPFVLLGLVLSVLIGIAIATDRLKIRRNLLFLKKEHEHQTWWQRNKDAIVQQVIGAMVGAAVGGMIGYFLGVEQATRSNLASPQQTLSAPQPSTNQSPADK